MEIFSVSSMPYVWLAVMVLCIIIEACTVALTSVWGAISAFVLVFVSRTGMPIHYQILLFLVLAIVLMVCTRPFAVKKLHVGKEETNAGALIGSEVLVVRAVEPFQKGEAKGRGGVAVHCPRCSLYRGGHQRKYLGHHAKRERSQLR